MGKGTAPPEARMKELNVLHLEDDPLDAELVLESLRLADLPVRVTRVETRQEFESQIQSCQFDVVLADYSLPAFDGITALRLTRETCAELPFIFVSGALGEETAIETLKSGATDYVLKHRLERLGPAVERALREVEALAERRRAEEAQARLTQLIEATTDFVATADAEGRLVYINAAGRHLIGLPTDQDAGTLTLEECFPDWVVGSLREVAIPSALKDGTWQGEADLLHRNGEGIPVSKVLICHRGPEGDLRFLSIIARDISDRKQLEQALKQRALELAEAHRRKDNFLAMLAHELRNPLAAVSNASYVLDQSQPNAEDLARLSSVIRRQTQQLSRLVDDLMDVSRITRGKVELRLKRVDLREVVKQACWAVEALVQSRGHHLEMTLPEDPLPVEVDPGRMEQVLTNLLNNAAKYTEPGGKIGLYVEAENNSALIRVCDTGIGIPPEVLPGVFELFMQGGATQEQAEGGLGVGLSLVRSLVEMHGGTVRAFSEGRNQGSEFTIRLPRAPASPAAPPKQPPAPRAHTAEQARRVLLVEDNPDAAETMRELLLLWGFEPLHARNGNQALEYFSQSLPQIVLMDIGLPGMDGYEVARRIRALPHGKEVQMIAVTGFGQEQDRLQSREAGFDRHLTKPIDPEQLRRMLNRVGSTIQDWPQKE
jgi:PAS domain S-box-containing protein